MADIVKDDTSSETSLTGDDNSDEATGYSQDELDAVMDYVQTQGDALRDLTDKLMAARRAYEAICWGGITNAVLNTLVENLQDLSQDAGDFSDELEQAAWKPALKRIRQRNQEVLQQTREPEGTYHPYQG